jgi:hypothetical protein
MRELKMPYPRAPAPEPLITARTQRWEPAEVIKALLVEEVTGRARPMLATRRKAAGFPTGKTFFLEALGQQVVEAGMRVAWFRLEDLGALMRAHRSDDSVTRVVTRILRADLIVIDDIGLLAVGTDAAEGLYCLVDVAYENDPSRPVRICTRPVLTSSCPKHPQKRTLAGYFTTLMSAKPSATPSASRRPSPERV